MDFGKVLHKAQQNDTKKDCPRYYSTKFEPPKKEQRSKNLSVNIQKFLQRKEAEEKAKATEEKVRRDKLLELRSTDKKATKRVTVMLKRTKSANQSVMNDAGHADNDTAMAAGPSQPDEDDYGYVSQSATDYYNKMMEKYSKIPDEPKFKSSAKKVVSTNLSSTKDRVKAALDREELEALLPHKRKRRTKEGGASDSKEESVKEPYIPEPATDVPKEKPKPKFRAPPPMNFVDLLKLAEKKQFEPIKIEPKKKEEPEKRPLTKKEKQEIERERDLLLQSQLRRQQALNGDKPLPAKKSSSASVDAVSRNSAPSVSGVKPNDTVRGSPSLQQGKSSSSGSKPSISNNRTESATARLAKPQQGIPPVKSHPNTSKQQPTISSNSSATKYQSDNQPKQFPPKDMMRSRSEQSKSTVKPKQFPPSDVRRLSQKEIRRPPPQTSRRPVYDDDDEEYDSEMDDFIDDSGCDDVSHHIAAIFGYDKRKYADVDDDVDDMESSFATQMREEVISTKMGIKEDLEDMKMEEMHKKKKALMMKNRRR